MASTDLATTPKPKSNATKPRKRFVGSNSAKPSKPGVASVISNQIPQEILADEKLNAAIAQLPTNYSFEIHKTIHHVRKNGATMVGLQMPEGLQMFACTIADIIEAFTDALTVIMGDVTYGACCIDDYTAVALGCDMLVHYGHSCLVPMTETKIKTLYVFVEISIDSVHLEKTVRRNFPSNRHAFHEQLLSSEEQDKLLPAGTKLGASSQLRIEGPSDTEGEQDKADTAEEASEPTKLALVSTIQFVAALQRLKDDLTKEYSDEADILSASQPSTSATGELVQRTQARLHKGKYDASIPRSKPLSPGEILGCTAPRLGDVDALIYLGDGRFHLEAIMIVNPSIPAFRYDPYSKKLTRERYDHREMHRIRGDAVQTARKSIAQYNSSPTTDNSSVVEANIDKPLWGVILGTLGRQGNIRQLQAITKHLRTHASDTTPVSIPYIPILLSELSPAKLALFGGHISTFVQTSCPRLSIDWGYAFERPLLSPYECAVAVGNDGRRGASLEGLEVGWIEEIKEGVEIGSRHDRKEQEKWYPMDFYSAGTPWAVSRTTASF